MAARSKPHLGKVLLAAAGFGLLMAAAGPNAGGWREAGGWGGFLDGMLFATAAGGWFLLWTHTDPRAFTRPGSGPLWRGFLLGALGYGALMGLRWFAPALWSRALIAGAAMAWLVWRLPRPERPFAR